MSRRSALALASGLLAVASTVTAPPAKAAPADTAPACLISGPTRLAIGKHYTEVTYTLNAGCPADADATWSFVHPSQGPTNMAIFDTSRSKITEWYDFAPMGTYAVRPLGAHDSDFDQVAQNSTTLTLKARSWTSIKVRRSRGRVTLTAAPSYYAPATRRVVPWRGAVVRFQTKSCPTCAWRSYSPVRSSSRGIATRTVSSSRSAYWRANVSAVPTIWEGTSSARRG